MSSLEQRKHPRYRTCFRAQLCTTETPATATAIITNLSQAGMQLQCDRQTVEHILPNFQRANPRTPVAIDVSFEVPTSTRSRAPVTVTCNVVYTRRQARDEFWLGAAFVCFDSDSDSDLRDYLENFGEPC